MSKAYTNYWQNSTCDDQQEEWQGKPLDHCASNQFRRAGIQKGDSVFIVTVKKGVLYLIGYMIVGEILSENEARRTLDYEPWSASDHLIAKPNSGTPQDYNRKVPMSVVKQLKFESGGQLRSPVFRSPGLLDSQTFRGVRCLTPDSARILKEVIDSE